MTFTKILLFSKYAFMADLFISLVTFIGTPSLPRNLEKSTVFVDENVDHETINRHFWFSRETSTSKVLVSCSD